jgi:hypothetical protein
MEDQFVGDLEKAKPISRQRNHFHCNSQLTECHCRVMTSSCIFE